MTLHYPHDLRELAAELAIHAETGRSDAVFRMAIVSSQLGHLASHLTHDQIENPTARPYGSHAGEVADAGHLLCQVITYIGLRNINVQEAVDVALDAIRDADFAAIQENGNGIVACPGAAYAPVWVDPALEHMDDCPRGYILVTSHPTSGLSQYAGKLAGIVTDQGGMSCHAAILAREKSIPCIVGTGNITSRCKTGNYLAIRSDGQLIITEM